MAQDSNGFRHTLAGPDGRPLRFPALRDLKLARKSEQEPVRTELRGELNANGQALCGPIERHRHGGLPGHIERRGERGEGATGAGEPEK